MRQTLFFIPSHLGELSVFGPGGILFWLWLVASAALLASVARRHGWGQELVGYLPVLGLIGATIVWLLPRMVEAQGLPIRGYGVFLLLGVAAAVGLAARRARQVGLDPECIYSLAFWQFVIGVGAARLFYVIEYWDRYRRDTWGETLVETLKITQGGLVVYGSLIGGALATLVFVRRRGLSFWAIADLVSPSVMLGLAIGRLGCFMNGCCYGGPSELPWAVRFPPGTPPYESQLEEGLPLGFRLAAGAAGEPVLAEVRPDSPAGRQGLQNGDRVQRLNGLEMASLAEARRELAGALRHDRSLSVETAGGRSAEFQFTGPPEASQPLHPAQVYSSIGAGLIVLVLLAYAPFRRRDGELFALMVTVYPVVRFLEEVIRTDEAAIWRTGMSISQNISLLLLVFAAALWAALYVRPAGTFFPK